MQISTIKRTWQSWRKSMSEFVTHPAMVRPSAGARPGSVFPVAFRQRQIGQPSRQISAAVQEIDDDDLLSVFDEYDIDAEEV